MTSTSKSQPIAFPARPKDPNGHGANAFAFGSHPTQGLVENISQVYNETLSHSRAAFEKTSASARDNMKTTADLFLALQTAAVQWNEKLLANTIANTEAALAAAKAMSAVHRVEDLARLQNDFFQKQMSTATEQTKELFILSNQIFQNTVAAFQTAATGTLKAPWTFK